MKNKKIVTIFSTLLISSSLLSSVSYASENTQNTTGFNYVLSNGAVLSFDTKSELDSFLKSSERKEIENSLIKQREELDSNAIDNVEEAENTLNPQGTVKNLTGDHFGNLSKGCTLISKSSIKTYRLKDVSSDAYTSKHVIMGNKTFTGSIKAEYEGAGVTISASKTTGSSQDFPANKSKKSNVGLYKKGRFFKARCINKTQRQKFNLIDFETTTRPYLKLRYL